MGEKLADGPHTAAISRDIHRLPGVFGSPDAAAATAAAVQ